MELVLGTPVQSDPSYFSRTGMNIVARVLAVSLGTPRKQQY